MKLLKRDKDKLIVRLGRREKGLLTQLLGLYPLMPPEHQKLSKSGKTAAGTQELLEEALAENRRDQQNAIAALLKDSKRWSEDHQGWTLTLNSGDVEWLLQVLNDIRVGSWVRLGAPEEPIQAVNEQNAPHLWAMELSGAFQMAFLHTIEGVTGSSEHS